MTLFCYTGLKRDITDDKFALDGLRSTLEAQHAIAVLKDQIAKDMEELKESVHESNFGLGRFNITSPGQESFQTEENDSVLADAIEKVMDDITSKFESSEGELKQVNNDLSKHQNAVSEKRALYSREQQTYDITRTKMQNLEEAGGPIDKVQEMVRELAEYEAENGVATPAISATRPRELLEYLEQRLEAEESESVEGIQPDVVKKIVKRLKRLAKHAGLEGTVACPCCERGFDDGDSLQVFVEKIDSLMAEDSPLIKTDEKNQQSRSKYAKWRKIITENMNDLMDFKRMAAEAEEMKRNLKDYEKVIVEKTKDLDDAKAKSSEIQVETSELRVLQDAAKMWRAATNRLNEKRMQARLKDHDLLVNSSSMSNGRDLKTVEKDLSEKNQKKDEFAEKVSVSVC